MQFEDLFEYIGDIGLYQAIICTLLCFLSFIGIESIAVIFSGAYMPHWCHVPELGNFSYEQQKYIAIPNSGDDYAECDRFALQFDDFDDEDFYSWNRLV